MSFDYGGDEILCSGYLTKRGHVVTNWKMRFFVLRPHANLSYYEDESMSKKLGQVHLAKVAPWEYNGSFTKSLSKRDLRSSDDSRYGFMFFTTKRVVYYIYTSSANEHQKWFHAVADFYVHSSTTADCEGYMTKKTPGTLFSFSRPKFYVLMGAVVKCFESEDAYRTHESPISVLNIRAASRWEDGISFQGEAGAMLFLSAPSEPDQQRWLVATQEKVGSSLQPIACAGYLTKQGHKRKSWKRRYFVLRGALLSYYTDYESANKQCLAEVGIEDVQVWDGEMHGFMFTTNEQVVYYVYADTERERQKWLVALKALLDAQSNRAPTPLAMAPPVQAAPSKVCPKCRHLVTVSKFCGHCGHHVDMPYDEPAPRPPRTPPRQQQPSQDMVRGKRFPNDDDDDRQERNGQTLLIAVMQATESGRNLLDHNRKAEEVARNNEMPEDTTVDHSVDDELMAALEKANLHTDKPPASVTSPGGNQATHNVIVVRPSRMADDEDYSESEDEQHPNQHGRRTNDSIDDDDQEPPILGDDKADIRDSSLCELVMDGILVGGDDGGKKAHQPRSKMEAYIEDTLGFDAQWIPSRDAKATCRFYTSKNYNAAADVVLFLGDSGQAGVWKDPANVIDDPLSPMSMLPFVEVALKSNFGVVLCNPHANTVDVQDGAKVRTFNFEHSASPAEHLNFVWTNYIAANVPSTTRVAIIAAGHAGKAVITLMQDEEASVYEKLNRVAFLQSTHSVDSSLSMIVLECLGRRAINWEAAEGQALCSQVVNSQSRVGCVCMATGFKTSVPADVAAMYPFDLTGDHLKHMQVPIFAYLTANPEVPGMTAIVKHMRSTLKKGRASSGRTRAPTVSNETATSTPAVPPTQPAVKASRNSPDPSIAQYYIPGMRGHTGAAEMGKKRQQAGTGRSNISIKDFDLLKVVGQGGFGKVFMGKKVSGPDTGEVYAIKVLQKDQVVSNGLVHTTMAERHILIEVAHPFVVKLHYAFQSDSKLYLVMDYLSAGSLAVHLRKWRKFPETFARFYSAEVALAIAHLHQVNIIYRDVKLENVLMDSDGHVSIADFGLSKQGVSGLKGAKTFCGTAAYIAPELLKGQNYGKAADWWSFGILLYEMIAGKPPYYHRNRDIMFQTILTQQWVTFTPGFSDAAVDLIRGLLNRDPMQRLGSGPTGADEVLMHPFFKDFDWQLMLKRQVKPPYDPQVGKLDTVYVPRNVRQDGVTARDREASMLFSHDGDFRGFSFIGGQAPDLS